MRYKSQTLFTKYAIEPNCDYSKLITIFQTNPNSRRDLPIVIQTIKDNKLLFIEELFTKHTEQNAFLKIHNQLLMKFELCISSLTIKNLDLFKKALDEFDKNIQNENFYYSKKILPEEKNNLINEFIISLIDELYAVALLDLEKINENIFLWFLNFFTIYSPSHKSKFLDSISSKFELIESNDEFDDIQNKKKFISNLPKEIFNDENIYHSYLYMAEKMLKSNEIEKINLHFYFIVSNLKNKDKQEFFKYLIPVIRKYYNLDLSSDKETKIFSKNVDLLLSNIIYYYEIFGEEFLQEHKEIVDQLKLLLNMIYQENDWLTNYSKYLKNVKINPSKENIYIFIEHILNGNFTKVELKEFAGLLYKITGFNEDLEKIIDTTKRIEFITNKGDKLPLITYESISSLDFIITPRYCDNILCKYYGISLLSNEIIDNDLIRFIMESALCMLSFLKMGGWMMDGPSGEYGLTYYGLYIKKVLEQCPSDFKIDNQTIESYLKNRFGYYCYSKYGTSMYSEYKQKYDKLGRNARYFHKQNIFETSKQEISINKKQYNNAISLMNSGEYLKAHNIFITISKYKNSKILSTQCLEKYKQNEYSNAIDLLNEGNYELAQEKFTLLADYRDSSEKVVYCQKAICEKEYQKACKLMNENQFNEAIIIFTKLKDYSDSKKKIDECKELIIKEKYDTAIDLMLNELYDEAISIFKSLGKYSDSKKKIKECLELINKSKYNSALELMSNGLYDEAISIFAQLGKYSDSQNKIKECLELINKSKYNSAVSLMNEGSYNEAINIFTDLDDYLDSKDKIKECLDLINRSKYDSAIVLMNKGLFEDAIFIFEELNGYSDSLQLAEECQNQINELKYNSALDLMNNAKYNEAIELFNKIVDYKDSQNKIDECLENIRKIQISKIKKISTIVGLIIGGIIFLFIIIFGFNYLLYTNRYKKAIKLIEDGKYVEAVELFDKLENYNNSDRLSSLASILNYHNKVSTTLIQDINELDATIFYYDESGKRIYDLNIYDNNIYYSLLSWEITKTKLTINDNSIIVDFTINPVLQDKKYEIVYFLDGGEFSKDVNIVKYYTLTKDTHIPHPSKIGYKFEGWTWEGNNKPIIDLIINEDNYENMGTLYANWSLIKYSIKYELFGGNNSPNNIFTYDVEGNIIDITLYNPTKIGYTFAGWYTDSNFKNKIIEINVLEPKDYVIYAKWYPNNYDVTLKYNDTTSDIISVTYNENYIDLPTPVRKGYTFVGWYYYDKQINNDTIMTYAFDHTLTAKWALINYDIVYSLNGGVNNAYNPTAYNIENLDITLRKPSRTGYTFIGWYDSEDFENLITTISTDTCKSYTLYAKWELNDYTIKLEPNNGDDVIMITRSYGSKYNLPTNLTRDGYIFDGWYYNEVKIQSEVNVYHNFNHTLYAKWTPETYYIKYILNGGDLIGDEILKYNIETPTFKLTTPIKEDYTFAGWYLESDFINQVDEISIGSIGNVILYAKWVDKLYTITLDYDVDSKEDDYLYVLYNCEFGSLPTPSKEGYLFDGWYYNDTLIKSDSKLDTKSNITLKAKWSLVTYTISYFIDFDNVNNINPTTFTINDLDLILSPVEVEGYVFNGWYIDSDYKQSVSVINKDMLNNITLYAKLCKEEDRIVYLMSDLIYNVHDAKYLYETNLSGWYYVENFVELDDLYIIGDTTIVLTNNSLLSVNKIIINQDVTLTITSQSLEDKMGTLKVTSSLGNGKDSPSSKELGTQGGSLIIISGNIIADEICCGGKGYTALDEINYSSTAGHNGGTVTIYSGNITANRIACGGNGGQPWIADSGAPGNSNSKNGCNGNNGHSGSKGGNAGALTLYSGNIYASEVCCGGIGGTGATGGTGGDGITIQSFFFMNLPGGNGGSGGAGGQGGNGGTGGTISIYGINCLITSEYICCGGDGGSGGAGGDGGNGSQGRDATASYFQNGAIGGNGGLGGLGGYGNNGGDGGLINNITVCVSNNICKGGKAGIGGAGGNGGTGGLGGLNYNSTSDDDRAQSGIDGGSGSNGISGNPGNDTL